MAERAEKYLVVRLTSLGDVLHTLPAVAALRAGKRAAQIDWVVERRWAPVLEGSPALDHVIAFDRRDPARIFSCVKRLREMNYSCAVDFQGLFKSSLLALLSGAPRRIGFERGWAREGSAAIWYTERVVPSGQHVTEMNYALAERAGGVVPIIPQYPLRIPAGGVASVRARLQNQNVTEYIAIGPGGSWRAKCWPADRFGALCRELEKRYGMRCLVLCGPGEESLAAEVCRAAEPAKPLIFSTSLEELMAVLARARCVVAVDSGPLHLAAALGAFVVGLYGPTDPARNGPFVPHAVIVREALPGETSYRRRDSYSPAMLRISVEQVVAAVERRLGLAS